MAAVSLKNIFDQKGNDKGNDNKITVYYKVLSKRYNYKYSKFYANEKLTSADPHTEVVATVQMSDAALLVVTEQVPAPTATDVGSFRSTPARVIVRVPVVEHPWTWRAALDKPPQETVLTIGISEQKTPRLGAVAGAHSSDDSHGGVGEQVVSLEGSPRMASVCEEGCGLMMLRERASDLM